MGHDLHVDFSSIDTAGSTLAISHVAAGGGSYERAGPTARFTNLHIRGNLVGGQSNLVTDDARNVVRIIVCSVIKGSVFAPTVTSILTPFVFPALDRVYADKEVELHTTAVDSTGYIPAQKLVDMHVALNRVITYYGNLDSNETAHEIRVYMVSDSAAVSNPGFESGFIRVDFVC